MGTLGLEVKETDLIAVSTKVKLMNSQHWMLEEGQAVRYCEIFEKGKRVPIAVARTSLSEVFPNIKYLYDKNNNVIAERACIGGVLRTTRKNNWLTTNKKAKSNSALYCYALVERIEDREYAKEMLNYFYANRTKANSSKSH